MKGNNRSSLFGDQFCEDPEIYKIFPQAIFYATDAELNIFIRDYLENAAKANQWKVTLSIFGTVLAAILTSSFNDFLLSKETWDLLFKLTAIGLVAKLLLIDAVNYFKYRDLLKPESLISKLKEKGKKTAPALGSVIGTRNDKKKIYDFS